MYFRLIVVMMVNFYAMRSVLNTLGTEDYGIYNVVAGLVAMFGFLSGTMSLATQRFMSFEIGKNNSERLMSVFAASIIAYLAMAILVTMLSETIGLWVINNKLTIPLIRMESVRWIYQFAIVAFIFTLITTPYAAAILAHEDMHIYALLSVVKSIFDVGIVIVLRVGEWDKLKLYGILLCIVQAVFFIIHIIICGIKYRECKFAPRWNNSILKEILVYNSWMLFGSFASLFKHQMINILLNQYFGPVLVGVRTIATQVNSAVSSFFMGFNMSMRPPIIKSYAAGENEKLLALIFAGTKGNFFLIYIFILPLILEMQMVFSLWLKNVPEYVVIFTRLILIETLIDALAYPINTAIIAGKKIRLYEMLGEGIMILNFPAAWIALILGAPVYSVMIIAIIMRFIAFILRFVIIKRSMFFPVLIFFKTILFPLCVAATASAMPPILIFYIIPQGFLRLCLVTGISAVSICGCIYFFALNKMEQSYLKSAVKNKLLLLRR